MSPPRRFRFSGVAAALCMLALSAHGQQLPDAGALRQQLEQQRVPVLPEKGVLEVVPPAMTKLAGGNEKVAVKSFEFKGNQLLSNEQLAAAVSPYAGRALNFNELQAAAAAAAAAYRAQGWVVRVFLPEQDVTQGRIQLQVVEARFGSARTEAPVQRVGDGVAKAFVDAVQRAGAPVNGHALDRALLLIDDLPGVSVTGRLTEGRNDRETDLLLQLKDGPLFNGSVAADNAGSRSTGRERLVLTVDVNSPLRFGDQISALLLKSRGSEFARAAYTAPLGSAGWRLALNLSTLRYRVITPEFAVLDANGRSDSTGAELSYPLLRTRTENLFLNLGFEDKRFDNRSAGTVATRYGSRAFAFTAAYNGFDEFMGGGATAAQLGAVQGQLDLTGSPNEAADAASTRTAGQFGKLRYAVSRQQQLGELFSAYASLSGQRAGKNLDSSERFYLGGVSGVRAYPASEAGGSSGQLLTAEVRARLPQNLAASVFYDRGQVKVNENNDILGALARNGWSLSGVGASLAWAAPFGLVTRLTVARRLGNNPNATTNGLDQDGTLNKTRVWVQATLPF